MKKGGQPDEVSQSQDCTSNSLGKPAWEGRSDERWRPAGGGAIQVDSCSAPGREVGGARYKDREKRH